MVSFFRFVRFLVCLQQFSLCLRELGDRPSTGKELSACFVSWVFVLILADRGTKSEKRQTMTYTECPYPVIHQILTSHNQANCLAVLQWEIRCKTCKQLLPGRRMPIQFYSEDSAGLFRDEFFTPGS